MLPYSAKESKARLALELDFCFTFLLLNFLLCREFVRLNLVFLFLHFDLQICIEFLMCIRLFQKRGVI